SRHRPQSSIASGRDPVMSNVLLASPSAFLRMGLMQQLRRRERRLVPVETSTTEQAVRFLADGTIDLAIVDDTLLAEADGDLLHDALIRHARRAFLIALREPSEAAIPLAGEIPVIAGRTDGVLDMGGIARALHCSLDAPPARRPFQRPAANPAAPAVCPRDPVKPAEIILVAASTGGPGALAVLVSPVGPPPGPVVVAQHLPPDSTEAFAPHLAGQNRAFVPRACRG